VSTENANGMRFAVLDGIAYVPATTGFHVVDVSDPSQPEVLAHFATQEVHDIDVEGGLACVATAAGIDLVDVSDPSAPLLVGHLADIPAARAVDLRGGQLGAVSHDHTMTLVDVSVPSQPSVTGQAVVIDPTDLELDEHTAYIAERTGLRVFDIDDPADPRPVGQAMGAYSSTCAVLDGERVFFGVSGEDNFQGIFSAVGAYYEVPTRCEAVPTPVTLSSFEAVSSAEGVRVSWVTGFEQDAAGYFVERRALPDQTWQRLHTQPIRSGEAHTYLDRAVEPGREYQYMLEVVDLSGASERFGPVAVVHRVVPRFAVGRLHPNPVLPVGPMPAIEVALPERQFVRLRVYDVGGQLVRTVTAGMLEVGPHRLRWDLRDQRGLDVASGVYYLRLEAGARNETRRAVVVR
jgi:hypothetical protein